MGKLFIAFLLLILSSYNLYPQLNILNIDAEYRIDLENTVSGVNNGSYNGSGFISIPSAGQLDSDGLIVTGMSDGDLNFGSSGVSGDFAQGTSTGAVNSGGVYAFEVSSGNYALGVQPTAFDWTPGAIVLKVVNSTGGTINIFEISYKVYIYNDQDRSTEIEFYYSDDNVNYINVSGLKLVSPQIKDAPPAWSAELKTVRISADLENSGTLYLKWEGDDAGGSGSRDEIALDDITITARSQDIKVIISEVADNSVSAEEYVEIFNGGGGEINIESWKLIERYSANNTDEREIIFNSGTQKNSGGSDHFTLSAGSFAVVVRSDFASLISNHSIGNDVPVFENFLPPAMTGDERYKLVNAFGAVVDNFGVWDYADTSSFRLTAEKCYERVNDAGGDGELKNNWIKSPNSSYNYTPGSTNITPLPVELICFNAKVKEGAVILQWETASEVNNYGFTLERSSGLSPTYKSTKRQGWEEIGFIEGHGNSFIIRRYSYIDYPYSHGIYNYRLKQIDLNGLFEYSNVISINVSLEENCVTLFQNYPNPSNPTTTINFSSAARFHGRLVVYNLLGEEIAELYNDLVEPEKIYRVKFEGSRLPSGVYYYSIITPLTRITKKLILMK